MAGDDPYRDDSAMVRGGATVRFRLIQPSDAALLRRELERADDETLYNRFFTLRPHLDDDTIVYLTDLDQRSRFGLIAEADGGPIAVARYEQLGESNRAEIAVTVRPEWRRRGVARELLARVVRHARAMDFDELEAVCLSENEGAVYLLESVGFEFGPDDQGVRTGQMSLMVRNGEA